MSAVAPLRRPFGFLAPAAPAARPSSPAVARPRPTAARSRPRLVLVAPARPAPGRLPFVILIGAVLVGGLLMLLMLHTLAAQDGFTVNTLQHRLATLTDTEQGLEQQVQADSAPAALRARAARLGMVPSTVTSYRKLRGGRAIGTEQPVYVPPPVTTKPAAKATAAAGTATTGAAGTAKHAASGTATGAGKHATGTTKAGSATQGGTTSSTAGTTPATKPAKHHHAAVTTGGATTTAASTSHHGTHHHKAATHQ